MRTWLLGLAAATAMIASASAQRAAVRVLPEGGFPREISVNGAVVIGISYFSYDEREHSDRVLRGGAWERLPFYGGGISGDGRAMFGVINSGSGPNTVRLFWWSGQGPLLQLQSITDFYMSGHLSRGRLNRDGSEGLCVYCTPTYRGGCGQVSYRWSLTGGGLISLPDGQTLGAMSDDARYFAGTRWAQANCSTYPCPRVIYWWDTRTGEMIDLPTYDDRTDYAYRVDEMSADGRSVLGTATSASDWSLTRTFVWSRDAGRRELSAPNFAGTSGWEVRAISTDGRFVAGTTTRLVGEHVYALFATLWGDGVPWDLGSFLIQRGAQGLEGSRLMTVRDMTSDARYVVGTIVLPGGVNRGYIARTGLRCDADLDNGSGIGVMDGAITIDDLLYFIRAYGDGSNAADVDDGSGEGWRDGAVTIDDLLYFLSRYDGGC